ncbi:hypothetical protein ACOMHN_022724 [Nucella lapillus]
MADTIQTVVDSLRYRAQHQAEDPAFIFRDPQGGRHVQTFQDIYRLGSRYAAILNSGGVGRGELVVNTLTNCPERVIGEAGIVLTGAASVNAQCMLADGSDLLATIRDSRASAIMLDPDVPYSPWLVLQKHLTLSPSNSNTVTSSKDLPHLKKVFFIKRSSPATTQSGEDFLGRLEASADWFVADDVVGDDVCSVFTTSGSTGFSKLVAHTHHGLVEAVLRVNPVYDELTGKEVEFSMAPLGWMGGYMGNTVLRGTARVLADTRDGLPADLIDFMLRAVREEGVGVTFIPAPRLPLMVDRVRQLKAAEGKVVDPDNPGKKDYSTALHILDRITVGGQPVTRTIVQMASVLARNVFVLYGATETFLISTFTVPDPHTYQDFDCGVVVRDGEVRIVSPQDENASPLPPGRTGMILVKRGVTMKGYLHDPEATASAFTRDGFFRTGDVGRLDERGHVIVEGRGSDAIMRGQYIFYPGWLEERIRACPGVRDVMVVGVPDPGANEEICACLTLASDGVSVQEVQEFVEKDIVTSDEEPLSPRPRHYLSFDAFPVTSTGKPQRSAIKKQAAARLSVSDD